MTYKRSLPSLALSINRIGEGLLSSVSGHRDCVGNWVIVTSSLVSQWGSTIKSIRVRKVVSVLYITLDVVMT